LAKLPNADKAIIAPDKLRDYLLNPSHRRGGSKAKLLNTLAYRVENWKRLDADLRSQHLPVDVTGAVNTEYGTRYDISAPLKGPNGRIMLFRSIWQIDTGNDRPRLITMIPE
jgi:hypothetical protein